MVALRAEVRHEISCGRFLNYPVELLPGLFQIVFQYPHRDAASVFVLTGKVPTLIDCGSLSSAPWLIHNLQLLDLDLRDMQIIVTHGHYDHAHGFHALLAHEPSLRLLIHALELPAIVTGHPGRTCARAYQTTFAPIHPARCQTLETGQPIEAGDGQVTIVALPGHSPGQIGLLGTFGGVRTLLSADCVGGAINPDPDSAVDIAQWKETLASLLSLKVEAVVPSHESPGDLPKPWSWAAQRIDEFQRHPGPLLHLYH